MTEKSCLLCGAARNSAGNTCKECYDALTGKDKPYGNLLGNKTTMLHDDIGDLVKFKENLRWRKWPEEKPPQGDRVISIPKKTPIEINGLMWRFHIIATYINGEFVDDASAEFEATHWLPLSALPAVEEDPK